MKTRTPVSTTTRPVTLAELARTLAGPEPIPLECDLEAVAVEQCRRFLMEAGERREEIAALDRLDAVARHVGMVVPRGKARDFAGIKDWGQKVTQHVLTWCVQRKREARADKAGAAKAADVGERCTMAVALQAYHVSRATIRRHMKDGTLHDHRPADGNKNATLLLSRRELDAYFPRKS